MARRRNPKKEKALRNEAYARKFRKRSTGGRNQWNRGRRQGGQDSSESEEETSNEEVRD